MSACPNINHPAWKKMVAQYGEEVAYEKFIANGYELPNVENVKRGGFFDWIGGIFSAADTVKLLNDFPQLASEIIDDLKAKYPEVRINKDSLLTADNKWITLQAGERGMHYRNAFQSIVAWSNDALLETPPHEYAHHYIDMFRNHPLVQKGIQQYGEEQLVTKMGQHFVEQKTSGPFAKWMQDFWNMIRGFFGMPDIAYQLSDAFTKGDRLTGDTHAGTAIVQYQKDPERYKHFNGVVRIGKNYDNARMPAKPMSIEEAIKKVSNLLTESLGGTVDALAFGGEISAMVDDFIKKDIIRVGNDSVYRNSPNLDSRLLGDLKAYMRDKSTAEEVMNFFLNNGELKSDKAIAAADMIIKMERRKFYMDKYQNSIAIGDDTLVSREAVVNDIRNEVNATSERRKAVYAKIKYAPLKKVMMGIEKKLLPLQLNSRLITKYLSGGEGSLLSRMFYQSLNKAENTRISIMRNFSKLTNFGEVPAEYKRWSFADNKKRNIAELMTRSFDVRLEGNPDSVKVNLTQAEILHVYLMLRQPDSSTAIRSNGFILEDTIEGRNIPYNTVIRFDINQANQLVKQVEADTTLMDMVKKIDAGMDYMYTEVNETFRQEHGYDLEKRDGYFPVYSGKMSMDQRRSKSSIEDFRAGYARLGPTAPIRIMDVKSAMHTAKLNSSGYAAYSLPIQNNRKIISDIEDNYYGTQEGIYLEQLKSVMNQMEDNSNLYSGQGEEGFSKFVNKITSNFGVSVLAFNIPVMLKQPVAYITAAEEIDSKYLRKAGWGVGGFVGISPAEIWNSIKYTGVKGGETLLPVEWRMNRESDEYKEMIRYSPMLEARFDGIVNRELGEALMNMEIGEDKIQLPFKYKGEEISVSKARLMEGIKIFDAATTIAIWKAVKLEANDKGFQTGTSEFYEYVALRTEEIITKTQPTYNFTDRSTLANMSNPIARVFTMFSSASSKIGMMMIDSFIGYQMNPTKENKMKLIKRTANVMVTTSITLAAIDMIKTGVLYGFDDDDDMVETMGVSALSNNLSYFYGLGQISQLVISQIDSKPWYKTMQHPVEMLTQDVARSISELAKGNVDTALEKSLETAFRTTGLPLQSVVVPKQMVERFSEDED